jgi:hypothetical protein
VPSIVIVVVVAVGVLHHARRRAVVLLLNGRLVLPHPISRLLLILLGLRFHLTLHDVRSPRHFRHRHVR